MIDAGAEECYRKMLLPQNISVLLYGRYFRAGDVRSGHEILDQIDEVPVTKRC